jgi:hypothetical protein
MATDKTYVPQVNAHVARTYGLDLRDSDTRPVHLHKFKPGDRAIGRPVKLGRKNRADRRAARAAST